MKFWGAAISPGKSLKTVIPDDCTLRLTQVSLGEQVAPGRSVLTVTTSGQKFVIASLVAEKSEHAVMELMFEEGAVEFAVSGKNAIHLAGNMMSEEGDEGMDGDEDEEMSEEESEEEAPKAKKAAGQKKPVQQMQAAEDDDDDDDEDEDEEGEGEEEEGDDDDDEEEEGDDDDDEEEEEEEPVSKKRPAPGKAAPPPAKAQKGDKGGKTPVETPKKDAPKSTPATPGSAKKEVPGDVKAKVRQILSGQAAGIKGADFPREWQKAHGTPFKDAFMKLGFKKQGEFMAALGDVVDSKGSGSEVTFFPKKK